MKKIYSLCLLILLISLSGTNIYGQVTFTDFVDNFNRASLSPGGVPSSTYTSTSISNTTVGIVGNTALNITVGGALGAVTAAPYATIPLSGFSIPFRSTLNTNPGTVKWTFNMKTSIASTGFASGSQEVAVVLGASSATLTTGTGYAVAFTTGANKGVQLIKYSGGIQGASTTTTIVTPAANILSAATNNVSVQVTYVPTTGTWTLFLRDDGGTASVDPTTGSFTTVGTSTDATYTGTALSVAGFYTNYKSAALFGTNTATFDNFRCDVTCTPPTGVFAAPSTLTACTATPFSLTGSGSSVSTWSWTGPSSYTSTAQSPSSFFPTAASAGVYTLTALAANGCPSVVTTGSVTVTTTPTVTINPTSTNFCTGGAAVTLTASTATSYVWTPNPGNLSAYTGNIVSATPSATTTYSVVGTNGTCTSNTATKLITVLGAVPTGVNATPTTFTACTGSTLTLNGYGSPVSTWQWTGPAGSLFSSSLQSPSFFPPTTYAGSFTLTATTAAGCSVVVATSPITVTTTPTVTITPSSASYCVGAPGIALTAGTANTYLWTPNPGNLTAYTGANVTATPSVNTTYSVVGTNGGVCSSTGTATISVIGTAPTITATGGSTFVCSGGPTSTFRNLSGGSTYTWSPGTGVSPSSSGVGPTFTLTPSSTTVYTITGTFGSCSNITTTTVNFNTSPTVTTSPTSALSCSSGLVTTTAATAATYSWAPSTNVSNTAIANPNFNPSVNTVYTVTGTTAGCSTNATFTVNTGLTPVFTVSPSSTSVGCLGAGIAITATSGTSPTYTWAPNSALSATTGLSVTASPTVTTVYTVTANDGVGCLATRNSSVNVISAVLSAATTTSLTTTSVHLSWTGVTGATGYTIKAFTNSGLTTLATSATTTLTSGDLATLSPNTAYWITIVANIGVGCDAPNSPSVQINTPVGFPYWESFESGTQNTQPTNWTFTTNAGSSTPKYVDNNTGGTPFDGSWDYVFVGSQNGNSNTNNWLISPALQMVAGESYQIAFNYNILASSATCLGLPNIYTGMVAAYISNNGSSPGTGSATMLGTPSTVLAPVTSQNTGWVSPAATTFNVPSTGPYYLGIRYSTVSACLGSSAHTPNALIDNIRICKTPAPSATSVAASPNPVCQSANLSLSATMPSGYSYYAWTGPNSFATSVNSTTGTASLSSITSAGAGVYTITVASDPYYTCTSAASTGIVTVTPVPVAISPTDTVICAGASYTLRGGNPSSATAWSTAPSSYVTVSSGGVVTGTGVSGISTPVTITYNNGCGTPATTTVKTSNSLGGTYTVGSGQQFPTLTDAVSIYNCATSLTGPVVFQLTDASYPNETYPITINNNAAASSTNTLTIRPSSTASPTLSGSSASALIAINGKYVIIEGSSNPVTNSVCPSLTSSRDLTLVNTNTGTSSAVVWMGSGANNDTVRNCVITGNGTAQTLVGVGSGGASIALNSVGSGNNNNAIINNSISAVQNGIYSMGASAGAKNTGTAINLNTVNTAGNNGIMVGFESGINIRANIVTNITNGTAGVDVVGINVGYPNNSIATGTTSVAGNEVSDALIDDNVVGTVTSTAAAGAQSAVGIAVAGTTTGTANTIASNAVYRVISASTVSDIAAGILLSGITSGVSDNVWYNTVDLNGTATGATNSPTYALGVTGVTSPISLKNNILVNKLYNGVANAARALGFAYSTYGSLSSDYNDLSDTGSTNLVSVGSLSAPTTSYPSVAAWQTGSGSTQDAHSINASPTFNNAGASVPDIGLSYAAGSNVTINNSGTPIGAYTSDANCATRDATNPDMGINEYNGSAPPPTIVLVSFPSGTTNCPVDKTVTANITIGVGAPADLETGTNKPRIYFSKDNITWYSNAGTYTSGSTTIGGTSLWSFTITAATLGLVGNETVYYYVVAQDQSSPAGVGSYPGGVVAVNVNSITAAPTPSTYGTTIASGTFYVGSGQDFTTLPLAVAAYNATTCLSGPLVFKLTDATYTLASPVTINTNSGASATNTLTIMPATGVSPTITCSTTSATISLSTNAKYIIIDGSNNPVTNSVCPAVTSTRNMTIKNTNAGTASAVVWLGSGANNNIIRNCNITGNSISTTLIGIGSGGSTIAVASLGSSNNNNRIENNSISLVQHGICSFGASAATKNSGTVINQNLMTVTAGIGKNGIILGYDNGATISGNTIKNINSSAAQDVVGINIGMGDNTTANTITTATYEVTNATITNNKIDNITNSNTTGYSATGILVGGAASGTNTIANNMISGIWSVPTSPDLYAGIYIGGSTGSTNVYYNSIYLSGGNSGGSLPGFGVVVSAATPINIKNNIIVNNAVGGSTRVGLAFGYATYGSLSSASNDIYATSGNLIGYSSISAPSYYTTLSAWNAASTMDAPPSYPAVSLPIATPRGSVSVLPAFTSTSSPVDLSLTTAAGNYLLNNTGTPVSVTSDIACATRDATYPDIGVNEFTPTGCSSTTAGTVSASTTAYCVTGSPTLSISGSTTGTGTYYQWQSSATGTGGWAGISGATNVTYVPTVTVTTYYRALVACLNTSPVEQTQGSAASVTIAAQPAVSSLTLAPAGTNICSGATISLTGVTTGGVGTPSYTWTGPGIASTTGSSLTSPTLTPTVVANTAGAYSMTVSYNGANCVTSAPRATASVYTVSPQPNLTGISLLPANLEICSGAGITLTATGSGGGGSATYTWSGPGLPPTTGSTTVSAVLHPTVSVTASGQFSVTLGYSGTGCVTTGAAATASIYTVSPQPSITLLSPSATSLCTGESVSISATTAGGLGVPVYTWSGPAITTVTGSTNISPLFTPTLLGTSAYSLTLSYPGNGCSAAVASTNITLNPVPSVNLIGMPSICTGITNPNIPYNAGTGGATLYDIAWDATALSASFGNVTGGTLPNPTSGNVTLSVPIAAPEAVYTGTLTVSNGNCVSTGHAITLTVYAYPTVAISSAVVPCMGDATSIVFTGTPGANVRYSIDGGAATNSIMTGGTYTLSTGALTVAHTYHLINAHNPACTDATMARDTTITPIPQKWVGGTVSYLHDWNTVTNWTCGRVPLVTDNVAVDGSYTYAPEIAVSSVGTTRDLTIAPGAQILINADGVLNVKGNITNKGQVTGNGKLVLNGTSTQTIDSIGTINNLELNNASGATMHVGSMVTIGKTLTLTTGTLITNDSLLLSSTDTFGSASIASIAPGAGITNKVIVHQFVQGGYRRYRFMSHPFSTDISLGQLQSSIDITGTGGAANGFTTTGSNAPSAFRYDPYHSNSSLSYDTGWRAFTNIGPSAGATNLFHRYQGIRLFMRGAKGEGLGYWFGYTPSDTIIGMTGPVNQGNQTVTLSKGTVSDQDYNMVGNPYPSSVDLGSVIYNAAVAGNVTGSAFYVWNPSLGASGQFQAIPISSVTPYFFPANSAFQVRADHDGATLSFAESNKVVNATSYLFKARPQTISLVVYDANYHPWDMLYVKFDEDASDAEDKHLDATKPSGADFNFYSLSSDNKKLAIDSRPYDADKAVTLGISSAYTQEFIIKAENVAAPAGAKVYLHDKLLQQYVLMEQGSEYRFTISKDKATQGDNRFELSMKPGSMADNKGLHVTMTPNPATDEVKVIFTSGSADNVQVRVLDMSGVTVYTQDMGIQVKGILNLPLSNLSSGVYMVELTSGSQKVIQRLIKE